MALSLYNKYRPQTFKDVVGQKHIETTLANAVEKNKVSHAYLFCGPRGTGKTTTARILAKALLCKQAPTATPDGTCEHCREISEGIHPDVYELDAASRTGVDNVREEIIGRVSFAPTLGSYKIYIIDEVHMLSTAAFNALLKTLEEPPSHVIFVLCTTDAHKVPATVQARCQRFDFKHLAVNEIIGRLQYICEREGFDSDPAALELIAQRSKGGMRDAIRSLEQVAVFSGGVVTYVAAESLLGMVDAEQLFSLCNSLAAHDAAACFNWVAGYVQNGSDIAILVTDLATHVRNLYVARVSSEADEQLFNALEVDAVTLPKLREQAALFSSPDQLAWILTVLGSLSAELKNAANARLALEVALTRIVRPESELSMEALAARVAQLEARLAEGPVRGGQQVASQQGAEGVAMNAAPSVVQSATRDITLDAEQQATGRAVQSKSPEDSKMIGTEVRSAEPAEVSAESASAQSAATQGATAESAVEEAATDTTSSFKGGEQTLYRRWNSVVDTIKKEKRGVAASLGGVAINLSKGGKCLVVELPAGASTSLQYLETDSNRKLLSQTVAQIFGEPLEVRMTVAAESASPVQSSLQSFDQAYDQPETAAFQRGAELGDKADAPGVATAAASAVSPAADPTATQTALPETPGMQFGDESALNSKAPAGLSEAEPEEGLASLSQKEGAESAAKATDEPGGKTGEDPSAEELSNILSNSTGMQIRFEEQ